VPALGDAAPEVKIAIAASFADGDFAARARDAGVDLSLDQDVGGAELVDSLRELAGGSPRSG
jgi:DNA-binding NarL/FixJ family response regulator